jgi:hypothetical protein
MKGKNKKLFIVYFNLQIDEDCKYKTLIKSFSKDDAKKILYKRIDKEFIFFKLSYVRVYQINPNNYRGKKLSDKQFDLLNKIAYPNSSHRLFKFKQDDWFKPKPSKNRNKNGTFKKGFTPWNKNLKLKFFNKNKKGFFSSARDDSGKLLKGSKPTIVGAKEENEKKTK